jgi:hypothetical protein
VSEVLIKQMPMFKRAYKKLHANEKTAVNDAIRDIIKNPALGDEKRGDLVGVFVYKFKFKTKEFLLAYEWNPTLRLLIALGVHENFYRDLKNR